MRSGQSLLDSSLILQSALIAICSLAAIARSEDSPGKLRVEAIGVRVSKPSPAKESTFWPSGTAVLLQVASPVGEMIRLDASASAISKISDDAGTDLLAKVAGAVDVRQIVGISREYTIDKEMKTCAVAAITPLVAAKGSKFISISGVIVLDCAVNKKETVVEKVLLRSGSKFTGPDNLELAIEQAGKPDYGKAPFGFVLRSARELDDLAEVKFFKASGVEIPSSRVSTSSLSIFGATKIEWTYTLAEQVESATVKLFTWSDMKKKRAEFELKVDLGL